jgi:hypothetical protein
VGGNSNSPNTPSLLCLELLGLLQREPQPLSQPMNDDSALGPRQVNDCNVSIAVVGGPNMAGGLVFAKEP